MHRRNKARARASKPAEGRVRVVGRMMLLLGAGVLVAAGAQSAAAASWAVQPAPLPPRPANTFLSGVSCTSMRDCVAVGGQT